MNSGQKRISFFATFSVYYFFVLLIPLLVIMLTYMVSYHNNQQSVIENQVSDLYQTAALCDSYMKSTEELAYQLSMNYIVREFIPKEAPANSNWVVADIYHMKKLLLPYVMTNTYVKDVYINFSKSKVTISNNTSYFAPETLWKMEYRNLFPEYEEWFNWFFENDDDGFFILPAPGRNGKAELLYRKNIEPFSSDLRSGILLFVNLDDIQDLLWGKNEEEGIEKMFLLDGECFMAEGQYEDEQIRAMIAEYPTGRGFFSTKIDGEKVMVTFCHSSKANGTYLSIVKYRVIDERMKGLKITSIVILLVTFLLAVASAVFFAYKTARPWDSLVQLMEEEGFGKNKKISFSGINQQFQGIMQDNKHLIGQMESLRAQMLGVLWSQLMTGQYEKDADLLREFEENGIRIRANLYVVITITVNEIDSGKEGILYRSAVNGTVRKYVKNLVDFYELNMQTEAMLITSDDQNYVETLERIEKELLAVQAVMQKDYDIDVSFSGSMCRQLGNVYRCLMEARAAMEYETKRNKLLVSWFSRGVANGAEHYCYTLNTEQELTSEIAKGNRHKVKELLTRIWQNNFVKNACSEEALKKLNRALQATIYRILDSDEELEGRLNDTLKNLEIQEQGSMKELFEATCNVVYTITEYYEHGKYANEDLYQNVLLFIDSNYMDNQLSLTLVAGKFEITEIYLSKFFKQKNGMNFSKYIEELRMKKASELLENNTLSVQKISEMVGYNSAQVFRRVYKKYYGKTPRE